MSEEKETVETVPISALIKSRGFVLAIVFGIIWMFLQLLANFSTVSFSRRGWMTLAGIFGTGVGPFMLVICALIGGILQKRLKPQEYALIFASILVSTSIAYGIGYGTISMGFAFSAGFPTAQATTGGLWAGRWGTILRVWGPFIWGKVPDWFIPCFAPPADSLAWQLYGTQFAALGVQPDPRAWKMQAMFIGGQPVPWDIWAMPTLTLIVMELCAVFVGYCLSAIFHKPWIEVERQPFPYAAAAQEVINVGAGEVAGEKLPFSKLKWLWIGFLIGLAMRSGDFINSVWPGKGWNLWGGWEHWGWTQLKLSDILPNSLTPIGVIPEYATVFYIMPLDVLATATLTWIVFYLIVPPIEYWAGMAETNLTAQATSTVWSIKSWAGAGRLGPLAPEALGTGMLWGLAIAAIIFNGKHIIASFKDAISGKSDPNEPLNYRIAWAGLILCSAILFAICLASQTETAFGALIVVIYLVMSNIWFARARAEGALYAEIYWNQETFPASLIEAPLYNVVGPGATQASKIANGPLLLSYMPVHLVGHYGGAYTFGPTCVAMTESLAVGNWSKVRPRDMFLTVSLIAAITVVVSVPMWLITLYSFGVRGALFGAVQAMAWQPNGSFTGVSSQVVLNNVNWLYTRGYALFSGGVFVANTVYANFIAGMILPSILLYLRSAFTWFWISPVGMMLMLGHHSAIIALEFPVVLAFKWVTFKIGGAKLYTNYTLPAAVGIACGVNLLQAISVIYGAWLTVR